MALQLDETTSWKPILETQDYSRVNETLKTADNNIFPPIKDVFRAFDLCHIDRLKVVILGQDPYHGIGQATGCAFSISKENKYLQPSLRNIIKEVREDILDRTEYDKVNPSHGCLEEWAEQGVLLLNTALTVEQATPNSHSKLWKPITDNIIQQISTIKENIVFMLWGKHAQSKKEFIDDSRGHLILECPHPSPLARGFRGNRHFSQCNAHLTAHGFSPIEWLKPWKDEFDES